MDWLAQMLGLPSIYLSTGPTRGGGVIQGTASEAVLTVMIAARDKYLKETLPGPDTVRICAKDRIYIILDWCSCLHEHNSDIVLGSWL